MTLYPGDIIFLAKRQQFLLRFRGLCSETNVHQASMSLFRNVRHKNTAVIQGIVKQFRLLLILFFYRAYAS